MDDNKQGDIIKPQEQAAAGPPAQESPAAPVDTPADAPANAPLSSVVSVSPVSSNEPSPSTPQTVTTPAPATVEQPAGIGSPITSSNGGKRKLFALPVLLGLILLVVGGGGAAAYFGYVVPNKPENVWAAALDRTGKGFEKLGEYAEGQKDAKSADATGSYKFQMDELVVDGTLSMKADAKNSETKINAGAAGGRVDLTLITAASETSKNPDIYVKASGLKDLGKILGQGATDYDTIFNEINDQWYVLDHTMLDSLEAAATGGTGEADTSGAYTKEELIQVNTAITEVVREYVLTKNTDKSVLRVAEFVGKEKLGDRQSFHYKVALNKANTKAFVAALKDKLQSTRFKTMLTDETVKNINESIDKIKDSETVDVWVDAETKLLRKVRFLDNENAKNYFDVSLNYNGGDEYPFALTVHTDEDDSVNDMTFGITLDTKKNTVVVKVNGTTKGDQDGSFTMNMTIKPSNETVEITKPTGAKSVSELLGGFMGGFGAGSDQGMTSSELSSFDTSFPELESDFNF